MLYLNTCSNAVLRYIFFVFGRSRQNTPADCTTLIMWNRRGFVLMRTFSNTELFPAGLVRFLLIGLYRPLKVTSACLCFYLFFQNLIITNHLLCVVLFYTRYIL